MTTTQTVPLSIRINSNLKKELDEVANFNNRSTSSLTIELIEKHVKATKNKNLAIESALKEAEKGEFISHEKVREWFASLGTDNELSYPEPDVFTKL